MFERFTDKARRVVVLAQEEARLLDHDHIGTEHLLLGLVRESDGVAARALGSLGVSLGSVRRDVEAMVGRGEEKAAGQIPFTPRAKKCLELSLREALQIGHNYIGTEHILLGLIREGEGVAARVLKAQGTDLDQVRESVTRLLAGYAGGSGGSVAEEGTEEEHQTLLRAVSPSTDFPTCGSCGAALAETLAVRTIEARTQDEPARINVAFCDRCGAALGMVL